MAKYKIRTTVPFTGYIEVKYEVESNTLFEAIKKVQITECVECGRFKAGIQDGVVMVGDHNVIDGLYDKPDMFERMTFTVFLDDIGKEKSIDCSELDDLKTQEDFETYFNLKPQ